MNRMTRYQPRTTWGLDTSLFGGSLFGSFFSDFFDKKFWQDSADYSKTDEGYEIKLSLPGISKDKAEITLENDVLSVQIDAENQKLARSWTLPRSTDFEKIDATFKDGLLVIKIPQIQPASVKIEIK